MEKEDIISEVVLAFSGNNYRCSNIEFQNKSAYHAKRTSFQQCDKCTSTEQKIREEQNDLTNATSILPSTLGRDQRH